MAQNHTVSINIRSDSGSAAETTVYTADSEENFSETVPGGSELVPGVVEIDLTIDVSLIQSFFIVSDKNVNLKTNENVTGDDHFDLVAGKPLWWNVDNGDNPFTTPITKLFFNNANAANAHVRGGFLVNALGS